MRPKHGFILARWLLDLALVTLVIGVLAALVAARGLPAFGHDALALTGRSMEPTMPVGAAVVLERVPSASLRAGDVVTIALPTSGVHFTHRIVEIRGSGDATYVQTKGDGNRAPDPVVFPVEWVEGRVVAWIPLLGHLMRLLSATQGLLFVLSIATSLYLAARLVEEIEIELDDGGRPPEPGDAPSPAPEPRPATATRAAVPDPALRATVPEAPATPAAPSGPDVAAAPSTPAFERPTPLIEPAIAPDSPARLSPTARRAYDARTRRRRAARSWGSATRVNP